MNATKLDHHLKFQVSIEMAHDLVEDEGRRFANQRPPSDTRCCWPPDKLPGF